MENETIANLKKVLLIKPPLIADAVWDPIRVSQALGLWYIGSVLLEEGHEVKLMDAVLEGFDQREMSGTNLSYEEFETQKMADFETLSSKEFTEKYNPFDEDNKAHRTTVRVGLSDGEILAQIEEFKPDIIGISAFATCHHVSVTHTAEIIRECFPEITILAGGAHATWMSEEVLKDSNGSIDACVKGHGIKIFSQITAGADYKDLPSGIAYLEDGQLVVRMTEEERLYDEQLAEEDRIPMKGYQKADFNDFPTLNPSLYAHVILPIKAPHTFYSDEMAENDKITIYNDGGEAIGERGSWTEVMFGKGCHRNCGFCVSGSLCKDDAKNELTEKRIREQLQTLKDAGYKHLVLQDDDLLYSRTVDENGREKTTPDHFRMVVNLMAEYGFTWQDNGGLEFESMDRERADIFIEAAKAGQCKALYFPLNPRGRYAVQHEEPSAEKRACLEAKYQERLGLIREIREAGAYVYSSCIFGLDYHNNENVQKEIEELRELITGIDFEGNETSAGKVFDQVIPFAISNFAGTYYGEKYGDTATDKKDYACKSIFVPENQEAALYIVEANKMCVEVQAETGMWGSGYSRESTKPIRTNMFLDCNDLTIEEFCENDEFGDSESDINPEIGGLDYCPLPRA